MKKFTSCIRSKANGLALRARMALSNQRGDFYISDAVKIIIAVVLGALLLAALTLIFNDTVIPRITQEIEGLFALMPVSGDQSVDIHSWSPLFYFLKKRITEVEDENILQILFLSAGRPWELAQCHLCQLWLRCLYVWLGEALLRISADSG